MTPTPEDIALATRLHLSLDRVPLERFAQIIAAHTAPLRERIKELEQQVEDLGYEIKEMDERE